MNIDLRVLIVEDRPEDAELMVFELRRAGLDPTWERVWTEQGFLDRLEEGYDVILADYALPQFNALRALHLMQERAPDVPFIVVTGALGDERAAEIMKHGATEYILKDRLSRLGLAVASALSGKTSRRSNVGNDAEARRGDELFSLKIVLTGIRRQMTNDLTNILGPAQLIRSRTTDATTREFLDRIISSSRRIVETIDRMEDLAPGDTHANPTPPPRTQQHYSNRWQAEPSERQGNVLIVEDDPLLGALLVDMLKERHTVLGCVTSEDVVQGKIVLLDCDVVIVDAALGCTLVEKLTAGTSPDRGSPVFVALAEHNFDSGVGGFKPDFLLHKPFDLDELLDVVARCISVHDSR